MGLGIKCYCADDTKRPKEIPADKWVKRGEIYHITHIFKMMNQPGIQGVELAEIDISMCHPYNSFKLTRFIIDIAELEKFIQMLKDCSDLNDIDVKQFVDDLINKEELILQD